MRAPSEFFTLADARMSHLNSLGRPLGLDWMDPYMRLPKELTPQHGAGYSILFADGHVSLVKRIDYLYPPRSASNWNRDDQPHPEAWAPKARWLVQR